MRWTNFGAVALLFGGYFILRKTCSMSDCINSSNANYLLAVASMTLWRVTCQMPYLCVRLPLYHASAIEFVKSVFKTYYFLIRTNILAFAWRIAQSFVHRDLYRGTSWFLSRGKAAGLPNWSTEPFTVAFNAIHKCAAKGVAKLLYFMIQIQKLRFWHHGSIWRTFTTQLYWNTINWVNITKRILFRNQILKNGNITRSSGIAAVFSTIELPRLAWSRSLPWLSRGVRGAAISFIPWIYLFCLVFKGFRRDFVKIQKWSRDFHSHHDSYLI